MIKVIFLDIDGVLNSTRSAYAFGGYPWPKDEHCDGSWEKFDQVAIGLLREIVKETGAVCVLSSTWRLGASNEDIKEISKFFGVPIIDCTTPYEISSDYPRGAQIQKWLDDNKEYVETYLILDDDSDMLPEQNPNFVNTDGNIGISYNDYIKSIKILGKRREDQPEKTFTHTQEGECVMVTEQNEEFEIKKVLWMKNIPN